MRRLAILGALALAGCNAASAGQDTDRATQEAMCRVLKARLTPKIEERRRLLRKAYDDDLEKLVDLHTAVGSALHEVMDAVCTVKTPSS